MPVLKAINSKASLSNAMNYVLRKSDYSDGIGCRVESALEEMAITKAYYGQDHGRSYAHLVISFPPGVGTPDDVLQVAEEFVQRCPQLKGFETVIGVHNDRDHLHAHLVINSVSIATGRKLHTSKQDLQSMKDLQNQICLEHGFEPPEKKREELEVGQVQDPWTYKLLMARQNDEPTSSWLYDVAEAIVEASAKAKSKDEFLQLLEEFGVSADWNDNRQNITYHAIDEDGTDQKVRASRLKKMLALACEKEDMLHVFEENQRESLCRSAEDSRADSSLGREGVEDSRADSSPGREGVEDSRADIDAVRSELAGYRADINRREAEFNSRQLQFGELLRSEDCKRALSEKVPTHARGGRVRER